MDWRNPNFYWGDDEIREALEASKLPTEDIAHLIDDIEEIDGDTSSSYFLNCRQMFYPSSFRKGVKEYMFRKYIGRKCGLCPKKLKLSDKLSIDHIETVAEHFNSEGYKLTREQRINWYNEKRNLQLVHSACNSRKGSWGITFDPQKVAQCKYK